MQYSVDAAHSPRNEEGYVVTTFPWKLKSVAPEVSNIRANRCTCKLLLVSPQAYAVVTKNLNAHTYTNHPPINIANLFASRNG
jgi:hypothetical protein